jgi:hypothetical protein
METRHAQLQRVRFTSRKSFDAVLDSLYSGISHSNMSDFNRAVAEATTLSELEQVVNAALGQSDLLEFLYLDLGALLTKGQSIAPYRMILIVAGNSLIMRQMTQQIPDAGSYGLIKILIYDLDGEVSVCYDRVASVLASYDSRLALQIAIDLDKRVIDLIKKAVE